MPYIASVERIGRQEGRQEGLLKGIELGLKLKFGAEGLVVLSAVLSEVSEIKDVRLLEAILSGLETSNTLVEWQKLYRSKDKSTKKKKEND